MSDRDDDLGKVRELLEQLQSSQADLSRRLYDLLPRTRTIERYKVEELEVLRRLDGFRKSGRPIVVGPWTGEVGFELLYWVPFVRWVVRHYGLDPSQVVALSRGGPRSWYAGLADRHADVLEFTTPQALRDEAAVRRKQAEISPFDERLVEAAAGHFGLSRPRLLHPRLMYALFRPVWHLNESLSLVEHFTEFAPIAPAGDGPADVALPSRYIAAKLYFSTSFPDTSENRRFSAELLTSVAAGRSVVLLDSPAAIDDHEQVLPSGPGIVRVGAEATGNLELQTRVVAGAEALVSTYGGFAYLGPFVGTPTVAVYSNRQGFTRCHLELFQRVLPRLGDAGFLPLDTADLGLLRLVAGPAGPGR